MTIRFKEPEQEAAPSLAYRLGMQGSIRFNTMSSGIRLTYEDNEPEQVMVHVAVKRRTVILEPVSNITGAYWPLQSAGSYV